MKKFFKYMPYLVLLMVTVFFISCSKKPEAYLIPVNGGSGGGNYNRSPVALAGPDRMVTIPADTFILDGTASHDPDGFIIKYKWSLVAQPGSPPSGLYIQNADSARAIVKNLETGLYQFQLEVTDDKGTRSFDNVIISISTMTNTCGATLPVVNAALTELASLSDARSPHVVRAGNKLVFAGCKQIHLSASCNEAVDIFDMGSHSIKSYKLSQPRYGMAVVSCENKVFFAGGNMGENVYDIVDIYDVTTDSWQVMHLSEAKTAMAAGAIGDKVFFAGGINDELWGQTNLIEIYDISDNNWSYAPLSEGKFNFTTLTAGNKLYFAGGVNYLMDGTSPLRKSVDIYDAETNSWTRKNLNILSGMVSGTVLGDNIYWSGIGTDDLNAKTEVWNTANGSVTFNCLSYDRTNPASVVQNNQVAFFNSFTDVKILSQKFDLFKADENTWWVGLLPFSFAAPAVISVNNTVYMAGGVTSTGYYSDKIYRLTW